MAHHNHDDFRPLRIKHKNVSPIPNNIPWKAKVQKKENKN